MTELCALEALELVRLVRAREVSRRDVIEAHLDRIEAVNGAVNAIVEVRDRDAALAEADAADREHERRAELPLDGAPLSIKDCYDIAGMKHTEGVLTYAERRSTETALVVERLQQAGGIVVGKGNQPDYQMRWNTVNDLYGATRNPRDTTLSAGGSTGGDTAAVAAGMAAIGLGGDYGGSIRVPASFCGIYGLRPGPGRIPNIRMLKPYVGPPTLDLMATVGPLARSLEDLWTAFRALCGPDPRDPLSVPVAPPPAHGERPDPPTVARIASQTGAVTEPEIERELDRVCAALAEAGYAVVEDESPLSPRAPELWGELVGTEILEATMPVIADEMCASSRQHTEIFHGELMGLDGRLDSYIAAYVERGHIARATAVWMEEHPLVVAPVAGMPAPPLDFDHFLSLAETRDLFDHMRNVLWVNLLNLPSISLPNGIQIVARRYHEAEALAAARVAAEVLGPVSIAEPTGVTQ